MTSTEIDPTTVTTTMAAATVVVPTGGTGLPRGRPPAVAGVLDALYSRLELGELLPGQQFRQDELAAGLGVSRAPVREALRVLEHDGVAVHHLNRGYFVAHRSAAELRQIHRMLELLEGELCARLPWPQGSDLARLEQLHIDFATVASLPDTAPAVTLNRRFHDELYALSADDLVLAEVRRLWTLAAPSIAAGLADPGQRTIAVDEHAAILDALRSRRRLGLLRALETHRAHEARALDEALAAPLGAGAVTRPSPANPPADTTGPTAQPVARA